MDHVSRISAGFDQTRSKCCIGNPGAILGKITFAATKQALTQTDTGRQVMCHPTIVGYSNDQEIPKSARVSRSTAISGSLTRSAFAHHTALESHVLQVGYECHARRSPGKTRSYSGIAACIGRSSAVRAVARAIGANQITLVLPCHRVIGADGSITVYGEELWREQKLLEIERQYLPEKAKGKHCVKG